MPEEIGDPRLVSLYDYWLGKRQGRAMPARADLDPTEIPGAIWPHMVLLDVVPGEAGPRLRYRRVGAVFWRADGQEPTGKFVDEVLPETAGYRDYVLGIYREIVERRHGLYTENDLMLQGEAVPMLTRRLSLPLSRDDTKVEMILTVHVFEHDRLGNDRAFPLVIGMKPRAHVVLGE